MEFTPGLSISGVFIACEGRERDGKQKFYALLSVGANAHRVGVPGDIYSKLCAMALGTPITLGGLRCTSFNGNVYFSAETLIEYDAA